MVENVCLGETTGTRKGVVNRVIIRIMSRWSKFRDLVHFLACKGCL